MTDPSRKFHYAEEYPIAPLEDDCKLLESLLDDCLRMEIGKEQFHNVELLRGLASSTTMFVQKNDLESAQFLSGKLIQLIRSMPLKQSLPVARACGHYLNLTGIAEMHHRVRQIRRSGLGKQSFDNVFAHLLAQGISAEELYKTVCQHKVEMVLTAHPTQIVRRSLQYKLARIAALLEENDRSDLTSKMRESVLEDLVREVTALWQTQEFRAKPPTPTDEARGGLHIVEQSLWDAIPSYVRTLNASLKKATDRELPVDAQVVSFGSWMGGDREGHPALTADVTRHVAYISRWIAADLYVREVDALRFELSMNRCNDVLWKMVKSIAEENGLDIRDAGWGGDHNLSNFSSEESLGRSFFTEVRRVSSENITLPCEVPTLCSLEGKSHQSETAAVIRSALAAENGTHNASTQWNSEESTSPSSPDQEEVSPLGSSKKQMPKKSTSRSGSHNRIDDLLDPIQTSSLREGSHPYRLVLGDVRHKLVETKRRMKALLAGTHTDIENHYTSAKDLKETLLAIYESLKASGAGIIADGRLLDVIRRVNCFGLCLMKMDIRQDAEKHVEAMNEITKYLKMGSYDAWTEEERITFLTTELSGKRPLILEEMLESAMSKEILETFLVAAELGPSYLGAYVISKPSAPSDILLVELFQREAAFIVARREGTVPNLHHAIPVVPMVKTLKGLEQAPEMMQHLFSNSWYRQHIRSMHGNAQQIMLAYSDAGRDACRLSVTWALYKCQEELVKLFEEQDVALSVLYGRGGCMGRGGGEPLWLAVQSQPPGALNGQLRMIEQGEMVQAKFGVPTVAEEQLETCASALLMATLLPAKTSKNEGWLELMESMSVDSCSAYLAVIDHPKFKDYFHHVTPELELSTIMCTEHHHQHHEQRIDFNKTIPWIFSWTQTRHVFPSWLGFGNALQKAIQEGKLHILQDMYKDWPLFHSIVDLIEMVLAKVDTRIASVYDEAFVTDPDEKAIGDAICQSYKTTTETVLKVTGHGCLCDHNPLLRHLLSLRSSFLDPINILQVQILGELRSKPKNKSLKDALMITINGIAAGMRNTG